VFWYADCRINRRDHSLNIAALSLPLSCQAETVYTSNERVEIASKG
jgi:hypothetical protein